MMYNAFVKTVLFYGRKYGWCLKNRCDDDGSVAQPRGMVVVLDRSSAGGDRAMADEGVRAEAAGEYSGVCRRLDFMQAVYRTKKDRWIQKVPMVVEPRTRTHTGETGGRVK